jgi:hypothetical protein
LQLHRGCVANASIATETEMEAAMRSPRWVRATAWTVLPFTVFASLGCYGRFPLTHAIYRWNGKVTSYEWVHSLLMWVLLIIPVYWVAFLVDFVIFNFVEFWFDETLDLCVDRTLEDGRVVHMETAPDRGSMRVTVSRGDVVLAEERHIRMPDGSIEIYDGGGDYRGTVRIDGDRAQIVDRDGNVRGSFARGDFARH